MCKGQKYGRNAKKGFYPVLNIRFPPYKADLQGKVLVNGPARAGFASLGVFNNNNNNMLFPYFFFVLG